MADKNQRMEQVVKVKRETLASCVSCPLCKGLLNEATTITECLHTFCRKCINDKLAEDKVKLCPVCKIDLGCCLEEKLRPDHNLQALREKLFPSAGGKVDEAESSAPVPMTIPIAVPIKKKEKSLSSVEVTTLKTSTETSVAGKRTKAAARISGSLRTPNLSGKSLTEKDQDTSEELITGKSISLGKQEKVAQNKNQDSASFESTKNTSSKDLKIGGEPSLPKVEHWKPLDCLVEAANRTGLTLVSDSVVVSEKPTVTESVKPIGKEKTKDKAELQYDNTKGGLPTSSGHAKGKRLRKKDSGSSARSVTQALLDAAGLAGKRNDSIWFSLVAAEKQECTPLPQISVPYIRIKDGNMTVLTVQKYLVKKLNDMITENEVQISCCGQPVDPALTMGNVIDLWLHAAPNATVAAVPGGSAKEYVMVLEYARKAAPPS